MTVNYAEPNLKDFHSWMVEDQWLAPNSAKMYKFYVKGFLLGRNADYKPMRQDVTDFMVEKMETVELTTCNFIQMSIKKYCEYLMDIGRDIDPTIFKLEKLRAWNKIPELLSQDEVTQLINMPDKTKHAGYTDWVMMQILYYLGLRIGEALNIRDVDIRAKTLFLMTTKSGTSRMLPLMPELKELLLELAARRIDKKNPSIFQARQGQRLSYDVAYTRILAYVKKSGIKKNITPHSFRHAFATHLMENGVDLRIVQELLGHANIENTSTYLHLNTKDLKRQFKQFHPRYSTTQDSAAIVAS